MPDLPTVIDALTPMVVDIDSVRPHDQNARVGDVEAIARSLERYGQVRPILVMEDGRIVAGNHTWKAAKLLGWEQIAVVRHDFTEDEARAYMLADNALADRGHYDNAILVAELTSMQEVLGDELEAATGYSADDLERLLAEVAPDEPPADDNRGKLLALSDVTVGEPVHQVRSGEVWRLGGPAGHVLVIADLFTEHAQWAPWLNAFAADERPVTFVPYPTPHLPFSDAARDGRHLVMVCPEPYLAGRLLDAWVAIEGAAAVEKVAG